MIHHPFTSRIATILTSLLLASSALAVIPNADNPAAFTDKDYNRMLHDWQYRTSVDAYKQHGKRNPAWDDAAITFLQAVCQQLPGAPNYKEFSQDQLLALAKPAIDAGCDDAMVRMRYAFRFYYKRDYAQALGYFQYAAENLILQGYIDHHATLCTWYTIYCLQMLDREKDIPPLESTFDKQIIQDMRGTSFQGIEKRIFMNDLNFHEDLYFFEHERAESILAQAAALPDVDQWIYHSAAGSYHIDAAWDHRGSGWARDVDDDAWQKFYRHLEQARVDLEAAYKADPNCPEPAAMMITVAMGRGDEPDMQRRTWFDRAVSAQFDYMPAYHSYIWSIRPRWSGSTSQMLGFALECMHTDRYDTRVPGLLYSILDDIGQDEENYDLWSTPLIYGYLREYHQRAARHPLFAQSRDSTRDNLQRWAMVAWRCGRFDEARQLIDRTRDFDPWQPLDSGALGYFWVAEVMARTGPLKLLIAQAEQFARPGYFLRAAELYKPVIERIDEESNSPAYWFIRHRPLHLTWRGKFDLDEEVPLTFDDKLTGWSNQAGQWSAKDGVLELQSRWANSFIVCPVDFGKRWEMTGKVEFVEDQSVQPDKRPMLRAGILLRYWAIDHYYCLSLQLRDKPGSRVFYPTQSYDWHDADVRSVNTFKIRYVDHALQAWINDQLVHEETQYTGINIPPYRIGFFGTSQTAGPLIRFSDIRIQRVPPDPDETQQDNDDDFDDSEESDEMMY